MCGGLGWAPHLTGLLPATFLSAPHPLSIPNCPTPSPSPTALQGSNSVSWAASFMSTVQLQGEGQGEGRDQSYLIEDQSVGAYFIQKSAKLEELELPPSPEGQVRRA